MVWRSIGVRLTAWYMLVLAAILLVAGAGVWLVLRQSIRATVDRDLRGRLAGVEAYRTRELPRGGSSSSDRWLRELSEDSMVAAGNGVVRIADARGHWLYRSPSAEEWITDAPSAQGLPAAGLATSTVIDGRRMRVLTAPIEGGVIQIGVELHAYDELTEEFFGTALVASPFLLGLAAIAGYWLSRRALRPVDAITDTARRIDGQTLTSRVPVPRSDDELRRLSLTLNAMLDRLETENRRTRQFTADASHELRTPVAVIRATADVTASKPRTPDEHQQAWLVVREQARRLAKMIDDLLHLARADAQVGRLADVPMDLAETVREACSEMHVVAAHAGLELVQDLPASCPFRGDSEAIHRLMGALLDNAVKYTPRGGTVRVTLAGEDEPGRIALQVADTGIGMAADELEHVFDRFYRVSKDRSRETGGSGLGLAIVQSIARQHGGEVSIRSAPGRGCVVRVVLPAAAV